MPLPRLLSVPVLAASAFFALEWLSNGFFGYGIFIDELYYLSCAHRLAAGYADHPPLSIWLLRAVLAFGDALPWLRLWPALAGGGAVFLAARLALRLSGSAAAAILTVVATAGAPVLLVIFGFYSMNAFEVLLVLALTSLAFEIIDGKRMRLWLSFGALGGLGLLNKHTSVAYAGALVLGIALSPERGVLHSRFALGGAALAFGLFLPNLIWQSEHGWVSLEFYANATRLKNIPIPAWKVAVDQLLAANPASLPILAAGIYYGVRRDHRMRFVPIAYLVLLALLVLVRSSRPDRIAALLPAVFACGGVQFVRASQRLPSLPWIAGALSLAGACVFAPAGLPLLSPRALGAYAQAIGVIPKIERHADNPIPQWFADRFGWEEVARAAERASARLTPEERNRALVLGASYGYAGACERFGRDLPPVVGIHNAWHEWGLPPGDPSVLVLVGFRGPRVSDECGELEVGARFTRPFTADVDRPVLICRRPRHPLRALWPELRVLM